MLTLPVCICAQTYYYMYQYACRVSRFVTTFSSRKKIGDFNNSVFCWYEPVYVRSRTEISDSVIDAIDSNHFTLMPHPMCVCGEWEPTRLGRGVLHERSLTRRYLLSQVSQLLLHKLLVFISSTIIYKFTTLLLCAIIDLIGINNSYIIN